MDDFAMIDAAIQHFKGFLDCFPPRYTRGRNDPVSSTGQAQVNERIAAYH